MTQRHEEQKRERRRAERAAKANRAPGTAERWNATHPVGTRVRYTPISGEAETFDAETRSEAWALGSGDAVVLITGRTGGVALDHLEVLP